MYPVGFAGKTKIGAVIDNQRGAGGGQLSQFAQMDQRRARVVRLIAVLDESRPARQQLFRESENGRSLIGGGSKARRLRVDDRIETGKGCGPGNREIGESGHRLYGGFGNWVIW